MATDLRKVIKWFSGGDTGMSSKVLAAHMATGSCDGSYPHDPADLGRCLRLLEKFPEWKPRIPEMARYGGGWPVYVANWNEMERSMADEVGIDCSKGRKAPKTYDLMHWLTAKVAA